MSDSRRLRIGIIGLGVGARHATSLALLPEVQIVAMADPNPRRLGITMDEFCAHFSAKPYADGFEMLEHEQLDAVSICTNPKLHRPLVEAAAERGLQVLLEKPMAGTVEDCDAMITACRQAGVQLHMEFPMRQTAPMVELRRVVNEGKLGRTFLLSAEYTSGPRPAPAWVWELGDGSSVINENTCHVIDTARSLLGDVDRVHAEGGNYLGYGVPLPDAAAFTLHFRSGAVAALVGGGLATAEMGRKPRLSLYGTEGQAYVEGTRDTYHLLRWARRGEAVVERDWGAPQPASPSAGPYARGYLLEPSLKNFALGVLDGHPPVATAEDGRENVRICLAILESIKTGETVAID